MAESYLDLADKQTYVANATAAVQAEKWLPKLRSNTFVVVVLLAPIVFLLVFFAPGSVIKWYGGMYVWLILWGAVDQLMFVMYQKELYDVFSNMRASGLGFLQVLDVKAEMLETLGLYGKMRWASMSLSLAMCMGILKIGNNAMVGIAENMGASAQQTAGQAASALSGIGGTDAAREQMIRQQTRGWAASVTPDEAIANQELLQHFQGTQNAAAMGSYYSSSISHGSSLNANAGAGLGGGVGALSGKLGADLGANASDSEVINMIPVSYQAKFAEISAMDISIADKTAMWNDFSAGVMGTVTHDSEETKMERLGKVVDENIEGATEWFDKNFSPEAVMERFEKQAETDPYIAEMMKNGANDIRAKK